MVYPDIQFKFIENRPVIVGYGKGLQILGEVFQKIGYFELNQKNYQEFQQLGDDERRAKLNRILWGNLRALAHGFDYWIPDPEVVKINGHYRMKTGKFKGNTMLTFTGKFSTNFFIPDYFGLGKQVARGYGTVKKILSRNLYAG